MVGGATVAKEEEVKEVDYTKIQSNDYTKLAKVTGGRFLLSTDGLNKLSTMYPFQELRFKCSKAWHDRHVDLKTTTTKEGIWARDWLLHRRSSSPRPPSCGSFTRLPNDSSFLGAHCERWDGDGIWDSNNLYWAPMRAVQGGVWYWMGLNLYSFCDDHSYRMRQYSSIGKWSYFIRCKGTDILVQIHC